ncbi:MAG: hypothetical protein ACO1SV_12460 [Fimbriimonas sp.]
MTPDQASNIFRAGGFVVVLLATLWSATTCELDRLRHQTVDRAVDRGATVVLKGESLTVRPALSEARD